MTIRRYWNPTFAPDDNTSNAEHLRRIEESLVDAVRSHMVADVPVGVFLSGGIDSSLITAIAAKFNPEPLQTFSVSFPGSEHDEAPYARAVSEAIGTNHRAFPFEPGDMREMLTTAAMLFDQPVADMAVLPLMALSKAASEHVKVELAHSVGDQFESLTDGQEDSYELDPLNLALQQDQGTGLADRLLLKGDYATMAFGLESRAPLLDHHLAAMASRLPLSLKATQQNTKIALREVARRYLPTEIITRRTKGFSMPIDRWFRNELRDWTRNCLLDESVSLPRYFHRPTIERLLSEHAAGKNHSARIHTLLTFELWCRAYAL